MGKVPGWTRSKNETLLFSSASSLIPHSTSYCDYGYWGCNSTHSALQRVTVASASHLGTSSVPRWLAPSCQKGLALPAPSCAEGNLTFRVGGDKWMWPYLLQNIFRITLGWHYSMLWLHSNLVLGVGSAVWVWTFFLPLLYTVLYYH